MILIFGLAYVLFLRPRAQAARRQRDTLMELSAGDEVLTGAGIFGTVLDVEADRVTIETAPGTRITVLRSTIARRLTDPVDEAPSWDAHDEDEAHGAYHEYEHGHDDGDEHDETERTTNRKRTITTTSTAEPTRTTITTSTTKHDERRRARRARRGDRHGRLRGPQDMKRSLIISLLVTVTIAIVAFAATLGAGWSPKLGLDLAGGSEVVYKPAKAISSGEMNTTVNIIRNRVDSAGVSGANVNSQGGNVVVQFPGVNDPQTLIKLIGKTAQLYFRPVLCGAPPYSPPSKGKSPPSGPLPSCGQYATTAANLNVNTSNSRPATTSPPTLPSLPIRRAPTTTRTPSCCWAPILLRGHSSTLASSWPNRHSTAVRSPRHRRCSIPS